MMSLDGGCLKIVDLFSEDCYIDSDSVRQAVNIQSMFNIIHNEWVIKADFIIRKNEAYRKHIVLGILKERQHLGTSQLRGELFFDCIEMIFLLEISRKS